MNANEMVQQAGIIRDFVNHPGMKLLIDRVEKKLDIKRNEWLNARSVEDAERLRQDGKVYAALMGILNEFLLRGDHAQKMQPNVDQTDGMR